MQHLRPLLLFQASACAPSIPKEQFSSLSRLDHDRLSAALATELCGQSAHGGSVARSERPVRDEDDSCVCVCVCLCARLFSFSSLSHGEKSPNFIILRRFESVARTLHRYTCGWSLQLDLFSAVRDEKLGTHPLDCAES